MFSGLHARARARLALLVTLAVCSSSTPVLAQTGDEGGELGWSVGAGSGLVLASLAVGGGISGVGETERARRTGMDVISVGMALGPAVSHAVAGEWKRAGLFGGIGLGIAAFNIAIIERSTALVDHGPASSRVAFGVALTAQVMVSTVGLIDSLMMRERRQGQRLALLPLAARQAMGVSLGGTL
jgi:hypothetical protein